MSTNDVDFSVYIQQHRQKIEELLDSILAKPVKNHLLFDAMRYSVLKNGKRLRPILVYAVGDVLQVSKPTLNGVAISVELIHCYSLIHDDLPAMDDDDLRRGLPTCHKAFDEATAILAGDALQALAFQILSDLELNPVRPQQQIAMVNALAQAIGANGMVLGQAEDLAAENNLLSVQELSLLHTHKTGALFNACIELAIIANNDATDQTMLTQLRTYGKHLGLAFQIQDDILDVNGDQTITGKNTGSDQKLNKSTFTSILGLEAAQHFANENLQLALQALEPLGPHAEILRNLASYLTNRVR